jgi:NAD(P)-dependent dehydrogenase (short-subunit alcohol dehydrogenase family)
MHPRRAAVDDFADKVALITGSAGNLGSATVLAFKEHGAKLALLDRHEGRLLEMYSALRSSEQAYVGGSANLADEMEAEHAVAEAVQALGRIDILVNIVGGYRGGSPIHETTFEDMEFLFSLNELTTFFASKAVIKHMLKQKSGAIVNVAAGAGLAEAANTGAYSATKSTVIRLTKSMAAGLKFNGIRVNCILPGTIDTPQNRQAMPKADFTRWVPPAALADVIIFLASNQARAITGAAIPVYGLS